jgi:SAM-dependent methyltransferase
MEKPEYEIMYSFENGYWWYRGLQELVEHEIRRHAEKARGRPLTILDAGCGTGRMMEISRRYGNVEGFDASEEALKFCAKRGLQSVSLQDITTWNPSEGTFDVIISLDVLCHSSIADDNDVCGKFHSALKPGGILILNLPAFEILRRNHDRAVHTQRRYTKRRAVSLLRSQGFRVRRSTYRLPLLFGVMLVKKILERVLHPGIRSDLSPLPAWLNGLLLLLNRAENAVILSGVRLPAGSSFFSVGQK